jgi:hypothetical protein
MVRILGKYVRTTRTTCMEIVITVTAQAAQASMALSSSRFRIFAYSPINRLFSFWVKWIPPADFATNGDAPSEAEPLDLADIAGEFAPGFLPG